MLRRSEECVINIPGLDLVEAAVGIGNTTRDELDKFGKFSLPPEPAQKTGAPFIRECDSNFECRLADARQMSRPAQHLQPHCAPESPSDNIAIFRKLRKALKPGGTLVVNDFVLNDDRTGHPFAMLFASQMLVATKEGFTYRQSDYRTWLSEAGFASVEIVPTPTPATVVLAK
jgi:hypothetical protein